MDFTVKQDALKEALGYVQVGKKADVIPVLSFVLVEAAGGNVQLTGTDLDVTVRCGCPAAIAASGAVAVPGRRLFEIAKSVDASEIRIRRDDNDWVIVTAGKSRFRLPAKPAEDFPEITPFKSAPVAIAASTVLRLIHEVQYAITSDTSRWTLDGAKLTVADGLVRMVATDGHRLSLGEQSAAVTDEAQRLDALVPRKAMNEIARMARDVDGDIAIGCDHNHIFAEIGGRFLTARRLTGSFPNYELVMPKDNDKRVRFNASAMRSAVKRVTLLMEDAKAQAVMMTVKPEEIDLATKSSETGDAEESVPATYDGPETKIGFAAPYLLQYLDASIARAGADAVVALSFKDSASQVELTTDGEGGYKAIYVLMPRTR